MRGHKILRWCSCAFLAASSPRSAAYAKEVRFTADNKGLMIEVVGHRSKALGGIAELEAVLRTRRGTASSSMTLAAKAAIDRHRS